MIGLSLGNSHLFLIGFSWELYLRVNVDFYAGKKRAKEQKKEKYLLGIRFNGALDGCT